MDVNIKTLPSPSGDINVHKHLHSSHPMHNVGQDRVVSGRQHGGRGVCLCTQINPNTHCIAHYHRRC